MVSIVNGNIPTMNKTKTSLGENIRRLREKADLTQGELAEKINSITGGKYKYENVKAWEHGANPKQVVISAISEVFGVPEQDLFDPSKREAIAREEIRKHPAKYYGEMDLDGTVKAEVMSATAAAGTGNNIESIDEFSTGEYAVLDDRLFKIKPRHLKLMRVDGHSMAPMLYPDSWVAYEPTDEYTVDGLYVINYGNELMVKLLQYDPAENMLEIVSKNPDYKSYKIRPDDQSVFRIVGRVLRCII